MGFLGNIKFLINLLRDRPSLVTSKQPILSRKFLKMLNNSVMFGLFALLGLSGLKIVQNTDNWYFRILVYDIVKKNIPSMDFFKIHIPWKPTP